MQYLFLVLSQEGGGAPLYAVPVSSLVSGGAGGSTVCMLSVSCLVSCML